MIGIILYIVIGLITGFSTLVLIYTKDWQDEVVEWLLPPAAGAIWPISLPLGLVLTLFWAMNGWAKKAANRIRKNKR